jgi:hypothetical protein
MRTRRRPFAGLFVIAALGATWVLGGAPIWAPF